MDRNLGRLGQRRRYFGVFKRLGQKRAYRGYGANRDGTDPTLLLINLRDDEGNNVADHLWLNLTQGFAALFLVEGEVVSFNARVNDYFKGCNREQYDYKLSNPTKICGHGVPDWGGYDGPEWYKK